MPAYILGVSAGYHDSAACVLRDGVVVAAAQEERFTRIKNDPAYPEHAIDACLGQAGVAGRDLLRIAFYEKPLIKLERILDTSMSVAPRGIVAFVRGLPAWLSQRLRLEERVRAQTGFGGPFCYFPHHVSHAACAFLASPFEEAAVLTLDGVGEWTTNAMGLGRGNRVTLERELLFPHSLGLLYSTFTQLLGFRVNSGEYKVMGLAPYGSPRFVELIRREVLDVRPDGSYRLNLDYFSFLRGRSMVGRRLCALLDCPIRRPEAPLSQRHMDIARSVQVVLEDVLLAQARFAAEQTGCDRLCLSGGVALNAVANGRLVREGRFREVYIPPASGDAGGCVGAALLAWHHDLDAPRLARGTSAMPTASLGERFGDARIARALAANGLVGEQLATETMQARVCDALEAGQVVGWFQGAMEFGPRALGNRSILADPRSPTAQRRVNAKVKFREDFRPFAPSVLAEKAAAWFELDRPSPYMLLVVPVARARLRDEGDATATHSGLALLDVVRSEVPAVTHVDSSARVQTVSKEQNPLFHGVLEEFDRRTGCPVLLNTSFNVRGEPIVRTPGDACRTFLASGLDVLAIGSFFVKRPAAAVPGVTPPPPRVFPTRVEPGRRRIFGGLGGAIWGGLGGLLWWRGLPAVAVAVWCLAVLLAVLALCAPLALGPVERVTGAVGRIASRVVTAALLVAVFVLLLTPLALIRRALSGDPLTRRWVAQRSSYWEQAASELDRPRRMY